MNRFVEMNIKDLGSVITGHTPPTKKREYYGDLYTFIKPTDINENDRYIVSVEEKLSNKGYEKYKNSVLPPNTPCMVTIGSLGKKMCLTKEVSFTNQAINAIIVNDKHDSIYVYYLLKTLLPTVKFLSTGTASGRENLSKSGFETIAVSVPDKKIQIKIAEILSKYDDLIENNNRRITILEEMAQRLYREWFVHFRFPGHEKVKMVETELGSIPEGWGTGVLSDIATNKRETVNKSNRSKFEYYLPIDCLPKKSLLLSEYRNVEEAESSLISFDEDDILMGAMRVYFHKVICAPCCGITRSTCFVIKPKKKNLLSYLLMTLFQDSSIEYANTISVGATMPYVQWDTFSNMKVIIPDSEIIDKYSQIVLPIVKEIKKIFRKNTILRKTRDHLLPRLISGDIDVSDLPIETKED